MHLPVPPIAVRNSDVMSVPGANVAVVKRETQMTSSPTPIVPAGQARTPAAPPATYMQARSPGFPPNRERGDSAGISDQPVLPSIPRQSNAAVPKRKKLKKDATRAFLL